MDLFRHMESFKREKISKEPVRGLADGQIITLIPSILSTTFICYTHATFRELDSTMELTSADSAAHLTIAAILIISSCSLNNLSRRLRNGASTKDKINAPSSATVNVFAGIYALLYVGLEWYSVSCSRLAWSS